MTTRSRAAGRPAARRPSAVRSRASAPLLVPALLVAGLAACGGPDDAGAAERYQDVRGRQLCAQLDEERVQELFVAAGAARVDERTGDTLVGGLSTSAGQSEGLPQCTYTVGRSVAGARIYRAHLDPGTAADGSTTSETELAGEQALEQVDTSGRRCVDFLPLADDLWFAVDATVLDGADPCALTRSLAEELWDGVRELGEPAAS